uniref:Uncharacterized protein n=1 Tax=Cucumis melo TaxID=3656 RepID=A0A9I9EEK7_CUCME
MVERRFLSTSLKKFIGARASLIEEVLSKPRFFETLKGFKVVLLGVLDLLLLSQFNSSCSRGQLVSFRREAIGWHHTVVSSLEKICLGQGVTFKVDNLLASRYHTCYPLETQMMEVNCMPEWSLFPNFFLHAFSYVLATYSLEQLAIMLAK